MKAGKIVGLSVSKSGEVGGTVEDLADGQLYAFVASGDEAKAFSQGSVVSYEAKHDSVTAKLVVTEPR